MTENNNQSTNEFSLDDILAKHASEAKNSPSPQDDFSDITVEQAPAEDGFDLNILRDDIVEKEKDASEITISDNKREVKNDNKKSPEKKKKKRSRGCLSTIIWLICIVLVSLFIAGSALLLVADIIGLGKDFITGWVHKKEGSTKIQLEIEEGKGLNEIAQILEENDLILDDKIFKAYLKISGKSGSTVNYGVHDFTLNMGYDSILNSLAKPAKKEDLEVRIKSPMTVEQIGETLEKKNVCSKDDFLKALKEDTFDSPLFNAIPKDADLYQAAEGYLYADTYRFFENDDPSRVIQKMLDNLEEKFTPKMRDDAKAAGYTTHQIITMASVIEMEACGHYNEMSNVAAVFYNRLNNTAVSGGKLESDPTMSYAGGERYNTYLTPGLPPGPMSNFTEDALKAAVYPADQPTYFFFVSDVNGEFYFNETNAAHEATISRLKQQGIWYSKY